MLNLPFSAVLAFLYLVELFRDLFGYYIELVLVHFLAVHNVCILVVDVLELELGALLLCLQKLIPKSVTEHQPTLGLV